MLQLIEVLFGLNRTIVTADNQKCVAAIAKHYQIATHRFPTGAEYQTWVVPPEWNVVRASVTDGENTLASYEESPLFLAPYSNSFTGWVDRDELAVHTMTNSARPDCFSYEFRLAYDFRRRLNEWRITMPHDRFTALPEGRYFVDIVVETRPGELLIVEQSFPGASGYWFTLLSHYCHVGQVNDGIAGVAAVMEAVRRMREKFPSPRHGYRALVMPETIGSSIYVASNLEQIDNTLGAAFSEMAAADAPVQLVTSRRGNTYIDRVFLAVLKARGMLPARVVPFREGWGNDELVFDAPGVGVPAVSLDRYPFDAYHTDKDDMSLVNAERLEEMVDLFVDVMTLLERDYIPVPINRVPVYQTRFQLYSDWTNERGRYDLNMKLVDEMWSGKSVLDIALSNGIDPEIAFEYIGRFAGLGLVREEPVTPHYTRHMLFLPAEETN